MAAPTIARSSCWHNIANASSHTPTLPTFSAGDLIVGCGSFRNGLGSVTNPGTGWTKSSEETAGSGKPLGWFQYREMQAGDGNPTITFNTSDDMSIIWVVINSGTFDTTTPIDSVSTDEGWNNGTSTSPQASSITVNTNDSLGLAHVAVRQTGSNGSPATVDTSGWVEVAASDCTPGIYYTLTVVAHDVLSTPSTGAVNFTLNASLGWAAGIIAIKPTAAAPAGGPTPNSLALTGAGI